MIILQASTDPLELCLHHHLVYKSLLRHLPSTTPLLITALPISTLTNFTIIGLLCTNLILQLIEVEEDTNHSSSHHGLNMQLHNIADIEIYL